MAYVNTIPVPPSEWMADILDQERKQRFLAFMETRVGLVNRYSGDNLKDYITPYFGPDTWREVPPARQNIIDRAIRKMALVYKNQPEYVFKPDAPEEYDQIKRWQFFRNAERMANLLGTILLHPVIRGDILDYEVIWWYLPLFGEDPFRPEAIMYPLDIPATGKVQEMKWAYWDAEQTIIIDSNNTHHVSEDNPEEINPYGVLPFVSVHIRPQIDEYFVTGYGEALADTNDALNVTLTEMRLGLRLNMMGQWSVSGVPDDRKILMGVNKVVNLPENATLDVKGPTANISGAVEYLQAEYENAMQNIGHQVQWGGTADQPSAESVRAKAIESLERREDDVIVWSIADRDVYDLEVIISEAAKLGGLPKERTANYAEIEFPLSPQDERERDEWEINQGLTTAAAILIRENPDGFADEKAAIAKILENKAVNRQLGVRSGDQVQEASNFFERRAENQ